MVSVFALTLVGTLDVEAECLIGAVVVVREGALVVVGEGDALHLDVGAERQLGVADGIPQDGIELLLLLLPAADAVVGHVHQHLDGHVLVAGQVLFAAVKTIAPRIVAHLDGGNLGTVVNVLQRIRNTVKPIL